MNLGGQGSWTAQIDATLPFDYPRIGKLALVLTFAKQKPTFTTVPFPTVNFPNAESTHSIQVSGVADCATVAYIEVEYWKEGSCSSLYDWIDVIDPSGRRVPLHRVLDFSWSNANEVLRSTDMVRDARLGGNGIYTLVLSVDEYPVCSSNGGYVNLKLHFNETCSNSDPPKGVEYHSSSFEALVSTCMVPKPHWVGDGFCDTSEYNTFECGYDGGDCCPESCVSGEIECGSNGYDCRDPEYGGSCPVADPSWIGDGWCDAGQYNTKGCDYDGGDCCEESCVSSFFECGVNGYFCKDPLYGGGWCNVSQPERLGDGKCDWEEDGYNTAICGYDGGDCCKQSCVDGDAECGSYGFFCVDPLYRKRHSGYTLIDQFEYTGALTVM
jgi:hypothetical protein